jgi:hypothetical protein
MEQDKKRWEKRSIDVERKYKRFDIWWYSKFWESYRNSVRNKFGGKVRDV